MMDGHPDLSLDELVSVKRARGFRLYQPDGSRVLDCYQDNGRAFLGHRPSSLSLAIKNALGRGVLAPYPSVFSKRLVKALATCFPDCADFSWFCSSNSAEHALSEIMGRKICLDKLPDPGLDEVDSEDICLWRPCVDGQTYTLQRALVPILPFPGDIAPVVVCLRETKGDPLPSEPVSQVVLAAAVRCVYDVHAYVHAEDSCLYAAWQAFDTPLFTRRGRYLRSRVDREGYNDLVSHFINFGILLNPRWPGPSILPSEWSAGENAAFLAAAGKYDRRLAANRREVD